MKQYAVILFALMAMISSCSKNNEFDDTEIDPTEGISVTANIEMPQTDNKEIGRVSSDYGQDNSEEWVFSWESGDPVYMLSHASGKITAGEMTQKSVAADGSSAEYSGRIESNATNYSLLHATDNVTFNGGTAISVNTTAIALSSEQDGDLNSMAMISGVEDASEIEDGSTITPVLSHIGAFMTLDINFSKVPVAWVDVTLDKVEYSGVNTSATLDLSKGVGDGEFYSNYVQEPITVTPKNAITVAEGANAKLHLNILPTTFRIADEITATLYFSNGTTWQIVKKNTTNADIEFARATFNTTGIECDIDDVTYEFNGVEFNAATTTEYLIANESDLAALAALANTGALVTNPNCVFKLVDNIVVSEEKDWVPIGYAGHDAIGDHWFEGVFDGQGYTISGFKAVAKTGLVSAGLFGYIKGDNTVVKNLLVDKCTSTTVIGGVHVAILVGTLEGGATLLNCGCEANSEASSAYGGAIGGLVGRSNNAKVINCYNQGKVTGSNSVGTTLNIGGLIGNTYVNSTYNTQITNCYNSGAIDTSSSAGTVRKGGLIGQAKSNDTYVNLYYKTDGEGACDKSYGGTTIPTSITNVVGKTSSVMMSVDFVNTLNDGVTPNTEAKGWKLVEDGYPTFK